jgi:serine protease AprX
VQHRNDPSLPVPIKVLNLSFGTDSQQSYLTDPLDYAAEVAWRSGIVVVAAAGNSGFNSGHLMDPANDPYVISVGADDTAGTFDTIDDTTPDWSTRGDNVRNPDLVAPGVHIISLRDPGSYLDVNYPAGRVNKRLFRGSGTSQAAAAVSGAVALIEQAKPGVTPDQVKYLLTRTADPLPAADAQAQGAGEINMRKVANVLADLPTITPKRYTQVFPTSTGTGSIEAARGSIHVQDSNGNVLLGEKDIFGNSWSGVSWSTASLAGNSWSGGLWNGVSWSGNSWSGNSWSGNSWS